MSEGSPHEMINPETLMPPLGFTHAVVASPGRTVYLAGQAGHGPDGRLESDDLVGQLDRACTSLVQALEAAGGRAEHLVVMEIFTTDVASYRERLREIGTVWRRHFGKHFPAMTLVEVVGLFDPAAKVEIQGTAVIPD